MYIRSSIIAVLLVTTFISTNSVQAFSPQDFSPFGSGGSGGGSGSGGGMDGALSKQKIADDTGTLVKDLLSIGGNAGSSSQMDKRYDESGDGVAMSSGQQQDSLPQKAVDLMNDISGGNSMIIKRGDGEGKKNHGNKKHNNNKRRRHNNKKNGGEPSFATMPTSLRRRNGLIPLPGGGGSGGGLGGLAGGLGGKSTTADADAPSAGGFKMALIGSRKRGLGGNGRQSDTGIVKDVTGAIGLTDDPFGKSQSPINAGGFKLALRDLGGLDGVVDDVTGALTGDEGSDSGYRTSSHHHPDLYASKTPYDGVDGPQLKVLDHALGGATGAGPLGGGGASKLGMDDQSVNGPNIDVLKRRSLNQLSASDRMARAKQGVVVDKDNEQQHEAMKRDKLDNGGKNGMMGGNGKDANNGMMGGNGGQNPSSFSPSSSSPSSSNDPQYSEKSFMTSDSDKKEKKKSGGGGFSMALVDLPFRRRQLGPLGGDSKSGGGLSKLTGDDGLVGSLLGGLGGGKSANRKESITSIKQKSTSPSQQFTEIGGNDQFQGASIETPQSDMDMPPSEMDTPPSDMDMPPSDMDTPPSDMDMPPSDMDMSQSDMDMPPSDMDMSQSDMNTPPSDQNGYFEDSQADPNNAPYDYDTMGQQ